MCRQLEGMCVAQWEAVHTLLGIAAPAHPPQSPAIPAPTVAVSLAVVLESGPAALASHADLQDALLQALRHLPQVGCPLLLVRCEALCCMPLTL